MAELMINGHRMFSSLQGTGSPLLLIHGLGSSSRDWELQLPALLPHFQVITYDVRGHGRSQVSSSRYSVELFAEDAAALIRALGLAAVQVVGISMGGMIAFQLALESPDLVRSMVIVNSYPQLEIRTFKERLMFWQRLLIPRLFGMRSMGRMLAGRVFPGAEMEDLRRIFVDRWAENKVGPYNRIFRALVGWSVEQRLAEIRCPVLVVAADQDYRPLAEKQAFTARMPTAELVVVENARHALPVEHPQQFNQILLDFLLHHVE